MAIRVIGLGGTYRPHSTTELALRIALRAAADLGAETELFGAAELDLPMYRPTATSSELCPAATRLLAAVRSADGVIVASPGYHGGISGLVKNALDYLEELRDDRHSYLDGRAVGCIATASGWQATTTTLIAMRNVIHALRGWNTPLGVGVNTLETQLAPDGTCSSPAVIAQLSMVGEQVVNFARRGLAA
jgi:FMN reductase